jgi:hypothetical protein
MVNVRLAALAFSAVALSVMLLYQKASIGSFADFSAEENAAASLQLREPSDQLEVVVSPGVQAQAGTQGSAGPSTRSAVSDDADQVASVPQPAIVAAAVPLPTERKETRRRRRSGYYEAAIPPRITLLPADDWEKLRIPQDDAKTLEHCPPVNRTMWAMPENFDPAAFCARWGESALTPRWRPRIFYGIMFGYEFDMLEVVLHEAFPIVDKFIFAESTVTHSLDTKPTFFHLIRDDPRFAMYMSKVVNYTFRPGQKFRSGWDIERKQRKFGIKGAFDQGIRIGDVLIGNMDLDEPFQASYLMRLKYCKIITKDFPFFQFHFRYNLNCLQFTKVSQNQEVNFHWGADSLRIKDLYKMRPKRLYENFTASNYTEEFMARDGFVSWHMSTFGALRDVLRKLQNSPHRFLSNNTEEKVLKEMRECEYGDTKMWKIKQRRSLLPKFIQQNMCLFKARGWLSGDVTDD